MAKYSADQLKALGAKGHAFKNPDGSFSYPIEDAEDLTNAIHAVGRGGASHDAIRRYIIGRAKALGLSSKIPDNWAAGGASRSDRELFIPTRQPTVFTRFVALDDIHIRSGGDGRTVEAYATVWNTPAEVIDQDGHYREQISPSAFAKTLTERAGQIGCFYNHGRSIDGFPSDRFSMPLGQPLEIRADNRGLLTVTQYSRTELADEVLEGIRNGAIRGQSFSGLMVKSAPQAPPRRGYARSRDGNLPLVTRSEIALREYGPTPFPAYEGAEVVGVRAVLASAGQPGLSFVQNYSAGTPLEPPAATTPDGAGDQTEEPLRHSARSLQQRIRAARIIRQME